MSVSELLIKRAIADAPPLTWTMDEVARYNRATGANLDHWTWLGLGVLARQEALLAIEALELLRG